MEFKNINWNWLLIAVCLCILFAFGANAVTILTVPQGGTGNGTFAVGECLIGDGTGAITTTTCAGGGYTNLTGYVDQTAWRVFYSDSLGDVTELAFGTSGQYLKSTGAAGAPIWDTPAGGGSGDMLKSVYDTDTDNMVDTAEDLTCTDCINATEIEDIYILKAGYSTGALTSDLNIDSNGFVISYDDNKIGMGTATPAYKLDVVGSIQTDSSFRGDTWVSATGNSMAIQPTSDVDDYFSFKTPADRPTIKREGGKYIYIESTNIYDAGIAIRDGDTYSGTFAFEKDTNRMSLSAKGSPLIMKLNSDYDDYLLFQTTSNVPEMSTVGAADFKINAGGANSLLLNHAGGNVAVGASSTGYILGLGTGDTFGIGTTQWNSADEIDGTKIKDADYGDVVIDAAGDWQVSEGEVDHDSLLNFVANEHLDWTADLGATNIHAGNYTDTNTTYTGGRSLTLTTTTFAADSELYHHEKCFYVEDPVAADDLKSLFHFRKAATITGMWCESDQTVNMDLQLDDGTPADINGADLVCDSTPADDTSLGGDTGAGAGERLDLAITSVSGTPTWVSICFDFTYDD